MSEARGDDVQIEQGALLAPDEPPAFERVNEQGSSRYVLLCEHASNRLPRRLGTLGLSPADLSRHIAWDIGAAALARELSRRLDAPLFLTGYSRLVIDCNRPLGSPTSICEQSEDTEIPGNRGLTEAERRTRARALFEPFRDAVTRHLDQRKTEGREAVVLGVHSFTPRFRGVDRQWHAGVLYAAAAAFAGRLLSRLRAEGLVVGDNEPYRVEPDTDHTVPVHGDGRGLTAVLIEVRQDLLLDDAGVAAWAERLERALASDAAASD